MKSAMNLTNRDLELFKKLSSYGMLSTQQLRRIVFGGIALTTVLRRLRLLEENFFVRRLDGLSSHELLWMLTPKGAETGKALLPKRNWSKNMLEHDYKLLSLRLLSEGEGIARLWTPEHEIRSKVFRNYGIRGAKNKLIPDGIMSAEVNGIQESVAIELELTLKNQMKLKETLRRYQETTSTFAVWYIVPSVAIMNQVQKVWNECIWNRSSIKLIFSNLDEVMREPLKAGLIIKGRSVYLGEYWRSLPAQVGAQRVSTQS